MKRFAWISVFSILALTAMALADDGLLGGGKGNGGGGGGGSVGSGSGGSGGSGGSHGSGGGSQQGGGKGDSGTGRGGSNGGGPIEVGSGTRSDRGNSSSSSNNRIRDSRDPIVVESMPAPRYSRTGSVRDQARNEDRAYSNRYRNGYYQYSSSWCDDDFNYGWYGYSYIPGRCVTSPWYWYSSLPGYINTSRIQWWDEDPEPCDWETMRYRSGDYYDRYSDDYPVYDAIADLERTFLKHDLRRLRDLLPGGRWVVIRNEGDRAYRLRSDDLYQMLADVVQTTRTRDFRIVRVEREYRNARITAQHIYQDAWRKDRSVYMRFTLVPDRGGFYDVSEFETSTRRF